jgi:nicotinate-nucleotide adenylyltransferase
VAERSRGIGLLGGTFDPPHVGHVAFARAALEQLALDRVDFVVANDPWQKSAIGDVTPAAIRWELVVAALEGEAGLAASDVELRRGGPSYTIDTVEALAPDGSTVTLLLGADAAAGLETWHRAADLRSRVRIAVVDRRGAPPAAEAVPAGWSAVRVELAPVGASSTEIRRRCAAGLPIDGLVAPGVASLIAEYGLYGFRR